MAFFLLMILIFSGLLFLLVNRAARGEISDPGNVARSFLYVYAWLVCFFLCWMVLGFIGTGKYGSPKIQLEKLRRITHLGYYSSPQAEQVFTGNKEKEGFKHNILGEEEEIVLKPVWEDDSDTFTVNEWEMKYTAFNHPLRLDGECINFPQDWWFEPGDALVIAYRENNRSGYYISIRWKSRPPGFLKKLKNSYYINHGTFSFDDRGIPRLKPESSGDLLLTKKILKEGFNLYSLIRNSRAGRQITIKIPEWWEITRKIRFIRKKKGDPHSPMGVHISDQLFEIPEGTTTNPLHFYRLTGADDFKKLHPIDKTLKKRIVSFKNKIFYGFGIKNNLSLSLSDRTVEHPVLGNIIEVKFIHPQSWPLPPKPERQKNFIITSSREHIALDGYLIPGDNTLHPFYAIANFNREGDYLSLVVNDGRTREQYNVGEIFRLGDLKNGVLLSLEEFKTSVSYAGLKSVFFIILLTLGFTFLLHKEREIRPRLDLAWGLIWGLTLTILTVRLILAYRVSLLPPENANPLQLVNVFHKSLRINILAFLLVPLFLLLVRFAAMYWEEIKDKTKELIAKIYPSHTGRSLWTGLRENFRIYLISFVLIILGLKLLGANESFIGRINIIAHIFIIFLIALFARKIWESDSKKERIVFFLTLIFAPLLVGVVIGDFGFLIYEISLCLCVVIAWLYRLYGRRSIVFGILVVALLTLILGIAPHIPNLPLLQTSVHLGFPDNVFYRMVKFKGAEETILLSRGSENVDLNMLLRNSHQNWQMLHYAAEGIAEPKGYGQAALTDSGMTYPTAMTDCVYSIFFLSEHGRWAGIFLVLIYILLGAACLYGACSLPEEYKHRLLPLTAIGIFFAFNSLYMTCANLGLAIFTGQNVPLLGLYSVSDLIQGLILLSLAVFFLREDINSDYPETNRPVTAAVLTFFILAVLVVFLVMLPRMSRMADPEASYRSDHNFSDTLFKTVRKNLPQPGDMKDPGKPLALKGERLVRRPFGKLKTIEKMFVRQFNQRPDKFNPNGGLFYLERRPPTRQRQGENIVRINRNYFIMRSPFRKRSLWRGRIFTSEKEEAPTIMALRHPCTVTLSKSGHAETIHLDRKRTQRNILTNSQVLIKAGGIAFFELIRAENNLKLIPKHRAGWSIYVDGEKIETHLDQSIPLTPYKLIVIENMQRQKSLRYNLIYLGFQSPVLAYVQWRNGEDRRLFLDGPYFSMAYTLGKAADDMINCGIETSKDLNLTLEHSLHIALQKKIDHYGKTNRNYKKTANIADTRILSAAVMDSFSGEILALPSWPDFDPGDPEFEEKLQKLTPRRQGKLLKNNNLKNHAVGSTIKPLIFSVVSVGFQGKMDPANLIIYHKKEPKRKTKGTKTRCPHKIIGNIPFNTWDCRQPNYSESNSRQYLVHSRNYNEVFMGMLGMLLDKEDWNRILVPGMKEPDVQYRGSKYAVDFRKVLKSPFTLEDRYPVPRTSTMNAAILFTQMKQLYDVGLSENRRTILFTRGEEFLPFFFNPHEQMPEGERDRILKKLKRNEFLDDVLPDVVNFRPKDFQGIREDLVSFFLGGASCRWNNIHIMEAMTRMVTGFRVTARLEMGKQESVELEPMPEPINGNSTWKNANLISPLRKVGEVGTAVALKGIVKSPYRIVYKTGTIEELFEKVESEMLFFTVGRWDGSKGGFVPGETFSCYLYMQDSKSMNNPKMKKFGFAKPIILELLKTLKAREQKPGVSR